jgi:hypothetical protein
MLYVAMFKRRSEVPRTLYELDPARLVTTEKQAIGMWLQKWELPHVGLL